MWKYFSVSHSVHISERLVSNAVNILIFKAGFFLDKKGLFAASNPERGCYQFSRFFQWDDGQNRKLLAVSKKIVYCGCPLKSEIRRYPAPRNHQSFGGCQLMQVTPACCVYNWICRCMGCSGEALSKKGHAFSRS